MADRQPSNHPAYLHARAIVIWAVTIAWAGTIALLSTKSYASSVTGWLLAQFFLLLHVHLAPSTFEAIHFLIRKLAHTTEYAMLGLLLYHSFEHRHPEGWNTRSALRAVVIAGLYSLTDEYHQSFVPGRTASLVDCAIDTAGAFLGMALLYAGRRLHAQSSKRAAANESTAEIKKGAEGE